MAASGGILGGSIAKHRRPARKPPRDMINWRCSATGRESFAKMQNAAHKDDYASDHHAPHRLNFVNGGTCGALRPIQRPKKKSKLPGVDLSLNNLDLGTIFEPLPNEFLRVVVGLSAQYD